MNLQSVLAFLQPFIPLLKPEILQLEQAGADELKKLIDGVSSPDLKALLMALSSGLDEFAKIEIGKL